MKLTICQIAQLWLLLTAFLFLNSNHQTPLGPLHVLAAADANTNDDNNSSSSNNTKNNNIYVNATEWSPTERSSLTTTTTRTSAIATDRLPSSLGAATAAATKTETEGATQHLTTQAASLVSLKGNSISSKVTTTAETTRIATPLLQLQQLQQPMPSYASRKGEQQQHQQPELRRQKQLEIQAKSQRRHRRQGREEKEATKSTTQQRRRQQQQREKGRRQERGQRVGVLISSVSSLVDVMHVQQGFRHFIDFFQVRLDNATVEFLRDTDLSGFIKLLEQPEYTTVVKTLNAGINVDTNTNTDTVSGVVDPGKAHGVLLPPHQQQPQQQQQQLKQLSADTLSTSGWKKEGPSNRLLDAHSFGHCHIAEQLEEDYNKHVIFWPCPRMKISSNFLPSFEAISFAVQSIASKLNWTQVDIYVGDNNNWGLPLAIASKLQIPYRIAIRDTLRDLHDQDKPGKAIIITAPVDDDSTFRLLANRSKWVTQHQQPELRSQPQQQQQHKSHIKVLLIDIVGSALNIDHRFYKHLATIGNGFSTSNLLILTVLTEKRRRFLSASNQTHVSNWHLPPLCTAAAAAATAATAANTNGGSRYNATAKCNGSSSSSSAQQWKIESLLPFMDFFSLYEFITSHIVGHHHDDVDDGGARDDDGNGDGNGVNYDFIVVDVVRTMVGGGGGNTTHPMSQLRWRPLLILEHEHDLMGGTYITHTIQPGYDDWLLVSSVQLWHCGAICWTIVAICVGLLLIVVAAIVAAGIALRNYLLRKRLSKGPNKIVLSVNDFVFPVDSRRVDEGIEAMLCCWLQQLQEFGGPEVDKPDLLKGSIGSLKNLGFVIPGAGVSATANNSAGNTSAAIVAATGANANGKSASTTGSLARHKPAHLDMRARYNGDLVQLKEIHMNGSTELRSKAMDLLVMAHGLRHENINPLIGWLSDPNRTAMVFDFCSRGSLQDVLIMDEIKLDWSFRLSLLTDLVRGMRYLHASPLRVHGTLTSRNCVVDARWVLKITDYGLNSFYESQGLAPVPRSAKELLWMAPELLRTMKTQQNHHHHHRQPTGTQLGDVYSFGIIMQEVVVRGEPYCMLSLAPEEIIAKIKKPPPLIRPSVSKGAAPPEAINIMRQCWAEQPEMRPDFNSVYERFKMLNHGRKVNFVDTMFQMLEKYSNNLEELIRERTEQLDIERKKTEQLLNRMLPSSVAEKLKMGLAVDPEEFSDVTIYFSDIVGFTTIAAHCSPVQVVDLLNDLYTIFDATINAYNVYKVETIGDAYMVVSGLPVKIPDHAEQIATMALDLLHQSGRFNVKHLPGVPLQLRIGLHTGPCCAGVVGLTMPRYCLFGDTVNTASRMESTGSSWRIHMSQETRDRLEARGGYAIEQRGLIEIKGKGMMNTFWLLGKKGFDKPLPIPPPIGESHGLDESLIRNSITLKAQANKSRTSTNPSSSQSSSLAGESVEVKVEITPPTNADICSSNLPNSYSLDSTSTNTISPNATLCPEFPTKTPSASPQSRKLSELTSDNLLNPNSFNRLPNSTGGSSSRLYKKIEEMMDLSSPYNHYKCLSPSESNLTQFYDGKYLYSAASSSGGSGGVGSAGGSSSIGGSVHGSTSKFDSKPGSSRLLRRQFSLDRDDQQSKHEQHHQNSLQANYSCALMHASKASMLEIPVIHDTARSPKGTLTRAHKQNSTSITQDLEKIEEIPLSPASSQHHSSLDSNLNRSPPSTLEAQSPPLPSTHPTHLSATSPPMLSAPTSPAPSRTLNGLQHQRQFRHANSLTNPTTAESPITTTNPSSNNPTSNNNNINNNGSSTSNNNNITREEQQQTPRRPEITLTVETLLSR